MSWWSCIYSTKSVLTGAIQTIQLSLLVGGRLMRYCSPTKYYLLGSINVVLDPTS